MLEFVITWSLLLYLQSYDFWFFKMWLNISLSLINAAVKFLGMKCFILTISEPRLTRIITNSQTANLVNCCYLTRKPQTSIYPYTLKCLIKDKFRCVKSINRCHFIHHRGKRCEHSKPRRQRRPWSQRRWPNCWTLRNSWLWLRGRALSLHLRRARRSETEKRKWKQNDGDLSEEGKSRMVWGMIVENGNKMYTKREMRVLA